MYIRERVRGSRPGPADDPHLTRKSMSTTATIMRGTRLFRGGIATDILLVAVFCALAYVFIARKNNGDMLDTVGNPKVVGKDSTKMTQSQDQHLIDVRMKKIPDYRSTECRDKTYSGLEKVSIVTTFFDYSFHDLKTTLGSIMMHTPKELIEEILIIDDGTTLGYIVDKSKDYVKTLEKVRLIRNDEQMWTSGARMRGFREATSNIVVFVSANVVVANGWLEPLIAQLKKEPNNIAVPHYDSITDPVSYEYKASVDELTASMSWSLSVRMTPAEGKDQAVSTPLDSPALRGNALAVTKSGFTKIGAYDEGFQDGGGSDLELSVRAWLCGVKVQIVRCSRVGVINLQDPVKIVSPINVRRMTELWFLGRQTLVFRNTGVSNAMSTDEQESLKTRKSQLANLGLHCQTIEWYFNHIVNHVLTPSDKAVQFGLIKCKTGRCMGVGEDHRLDLTQCKSEHFSTPKVHMLFELTEDGLLVNNGKCLTVQETAYITLEDCKQEDGKQKWAHTDFRLVNEWSKYCMMHVTDPDKTSDGKRQIVMAQECSTAPEPQFTTFDFVNI